MSNEGQWSDDWHPPKKARTFLHMPGAWFQKCPVRKVLKRWGWVEKDWWTTPLCEWQGNTFLGTADLFWSVDASLPSWYSFPNVGIVNHYDGTCYLCSKLALGWCLDGCKECAAQFFPRQYSVCIPNEFREFLKDFAAMQDTTTRQLLMGKVAGNLPPAVQALLWSFLDQPPAGQNGKSAADFNAIDATSKVVRRGQQEPHHVMSGPANAWVVKGIDGGWMGNNGMAVSMYTSLGDILWEFGYYKWQCVVQKYLERPLLIPEAPGKPASNKIDLRLWCFILDLNPLIVFVHPEAYFRIATTEYKFSSGSTPDPYAHKTNWRDRENRVTLKDVFERGGDFAEQTWYSRTWPLILDAVRAAILSTADLSLGPTVHGRPRKPCPPTFELFGFDFALDDEWKPWLLEVNRSPAMLDDTTIPALLEFADTATESMLTMAFAYYEDGSLVIPSVEELELREAPEASTSERLFSEILDPSQKRHSPHKWCYGKEVMKIPPCLVQGLSLGPPCGQWLLVYRTPTRDKKVLERWSTAEWNKWNVDFETSCFGKSAW
mmetsp:Transcript_46820/g.74739  ORF Transcript_46820/g.74739 Transcript_46820/m.74739 type:complete len:547 (+) Transcript_46820:51-1691(+)